MTIEDLKRSILAIKTECGKHDYNCNGCPLQKGYNICGVVGDVAKSETCNRKPQYWKIVEEVKLFEQ